ncbi:MAG: threonylcarbamoyl-AMP synthase [Deltaproteobacteria bacterium]|nr:threonylcarbamoyl-AMP synthase [Deltaproteobacteria bacterium]
MIDNPDKVLQVDPHFPDADTIERAASCIRDGGLVVFPTHAFYGLAAKALDPHAVEAVFRAKQRDPAKPVLILISTLSEMTELARSVPDKAVTLIRAFWPGGVTLVFDGVAGLPVGVTGPSGKIGIRIPGHPVAAALVRAVGQPVTGTSANLSGHDPAARTEALEAAMLEHVDVVLNAGTLAGGKGSTVVDVTEGGVKILRPGRISLAMILTALNG